MNDLEDPPSSKDTGKLEKVSKKSLPPGPEIVTNITGPNVTQIFSNEPGENEGKNQVRAAENFSSAAATTVVAELVEPQVERGSTENNKDSRDHPIIEKKPWYQNSVTMSFIAFVLLLIAGVSIGMAVIMRGKDSSPASSPMSPTPSDSPIPSDAPTPKIDSPNLSETKPPTASPYPTPQPTVPLPRCINDGNCTSTPCAYESYTTTSQKVCCESSSVRIYSSDDSAFPKGEYSAYFCKGQPSGSRCPVNNLCASGVCVQKTCRDGLQGTDEACDDNNDCASRVCVKSVCKAGLLGPSSPCDDKNDCTSASCSYGSYTPTSQLVCCASESVRIYSYQDTAFPKEGSSAYFCKGQPTDSRCPLNQLCASGVCVQKTCEDGLQETDEACDDNNDCASGVCVNNVCKAGLLGPSLPCDDNNDCTSVTCSYGSYTPTSQLVCCASESVKIYSYQDTAFPKEGSPAYFCKGQPSGSRCPLNQLCASGVCVQKTCRDGLQGTDEACDDNNDCASRVCVKSVCKAGLLGPSSPCDDNNDCTSASCAFDSYTTTSQLECCASESVKIYSYQDTAFPKEYSPAYFCKGQPTGSRCPLNQLCASGVCVQKTCRDGLQGTDEACDDNNDCASGVCTNNVCEA